MSATNEQNRKQLDPGQLHAGVTVWQSNVGDLSYVTTPSGFARHPSKEGTYRNHSLDSRFRGNDDLYVSHYVV